MGGLKVSSTKCASVTLATITLVNHSRMSYMITGVMSRGMLRVPCTRTFPGHFPSQAPPLPFVFAPACLAPQKNMRGGRWRPGLQLAARKKKKDTVVVRIVRVQHLRQRFVLMIVHADIVLMQCLWFSTFACVRIPVFVPCCLFLSTGSFKLAALPYKTRCFSQDCAVLGIIQRQLTAYTPHGLTILGIAMLRKGVMHIRSMLQC